MNNKAYKTHFEHLSDLKIMKEMKLEECLFLKDYNG